LVVVDWARYWRTRYRCLPAQQVDLQPSAQIVVGFAVGKQIADAGLFTNSSGTRARSGDVQNR
jgi:hypothetical protein